MSSTRLGILATLLFMGFIGLVARLFQLQIVEADPERAVAEMRRIGARYAETPAVRGAILDRDGRPLRVSRDGLEIGVVPARFRERSAPEAVADLRALLEPVVEGGGAAARQRYLVEAVEDPAAAARALVVLPVDIFKKSPTVSASILAPRMRPLIAPEGTLILNAEDGRARVVDACAALVPRARPMSARAIRARLANPATSTVGEVLDLSAAAVTEILNAENATVHRLASSLGFGDGLRLRERIMTRCDVQYQTVVSRALDERLNDAICQQEAGARHPSVDVVGAERYAEIVARARPVFADADAASNGFEAARSLLAGTLPGVVPSLTDLGPWVDIEPEVVVDPESIAETWGLIDPRPDAVRGALAAAVRGAADFETSARERYQGARKRQQIVRDLRDDRTHRIGLAPDYALADLIEGPGGLDYLGFRIDPAFVRDDTRAAKGASLSLLLGDVTDSGVPVGRGVELFENGMLSGTPGRIARTTSRGRVDVETVDPVLHGEDVTLALSAPLQARVDKMLTRPGAIAVVDIATGGILAASTSPAPKDGDLREALQALAKLEDRLAAARRAAAGGDRGARAEVRAIREQILQSGALHRAVAPAGQTPPGSVFKVLTLLHALERGVVKADEVMDCRLGPRSSFGCHTHGPLDMWGAIEKSCNHYCYEAALRFSPSRDAATAELLDLFKTFGLFDAVPGLISAAEGRAYEHLLRRRPDDPRNDAIGQGSLTFAPVRVAGVAASVAAGRVVRPWFVKSETHVPFGPVIGSVEHLAVVREGMRRVCESSGGTAGKQHRARLTTLKIAGKTGTAQLSSGENPLYAAWLVGYAPHDNPRYAFAVMFDRYPGEGADCAPLAAMVVNACYDVLGGRP